jgi:hypothetical protein
MSTSDLIDDVGQLPAIVGDMGLAIAKAQGLLDSNYLDGIERLVAMTASLVGSGAAAGASAEAAAAARDSLLAVLRALAPARYQYTETTLTVRLDLAQKVTVGGSLGVGANLGAVVVNAGLALGYAYDYRGAAEVRTVIHAAPAGEAVFAALSERADKLAATALALPPQSAVDKAVLDKAEAIFAMISGAKPAKPITGA